MPRRGENIYKRADGRWEARYIHHYADGRAVYRSVYAQTYSEVKAKKTKAEANQLIEKKRRGTESLFFEDVAAQWLSDLRISIKESTYTRYHRIVTKYLMPQFQKQVFAKIDSTYLAGLTERLLTSGGASGGPLSAKTVTDIISVMKSILKYADANDIAAPNWKRLKYPPKGKHESKALRPDYRETMELALSRSDDPTCLGVCFAYFTGVRIGELCGLRWGDIDFQQHTASIQRTVERIADLDPASSAKTKVIVSTPKTNTSVRLIPIPDFLFGYLEQNRRDDDIYLVTGTKKITEPCRFYLRYQKFLEDNNISHQSFHVLRHTFATRCVENGFDAKTLAEILGHSSITTTLSAYVHPSMEQKRRMMESLAPQVHSPSDF